MYKRLQRWPGQQKTIPYVGYRTNRPMAATVLSYCSPLRTGPMFYTVLSCGHDPLLLKTRDLILSRDGFRVINATGADHAQRILAGESVSLLLLCHTLSEEEFKSLLTAARALRPPPGVLALTANTFNSLTPSADAVFDTCDGPGEFLAAVHGLIDKTVARHRAMSQLTEQRHAEIHRHSEMVQQH